MTKMTKEQAIRFIKGEIILLTALFILTTIIIATGFIRIGACLMTFTVGASIAMMLYNRKIFHK